MYELLLTNVTRPPSALIVRPQHVHLERLVKRKACGTVSARVRLCAGVNTNVAVHVAVCLKQFSAVRTWTRFYTAVNALLMSLQDDGSAETFAAQRALVRFVRRVHAHVSVQSAGLTERFVAHLTFVRFLSAVRSSVLREKRRPRESSAAGRTFERFFAGMDSPVHRQLLVASETVSALVAHVLAAVNVHVSPQILPIRKAFLADTAEM